MGWHFDWNQWHQWGMDDLEGQIHLNNATVHTPDHLMGSTTYHSWVGSWISHWEPETLHTNVQRGNSSYLWNVTKRSVIMWQINWNMQRRNISLALVLPTLSLPNCPSSKKSSQIPTIKDDSGNIISDDAAKATSINFFPLALIWIFLLSLTTWSHSSMKYHANHPQI